jgi:hypothetical protein
MLNYLRQCAQHKEGDNKIPTPPLTFDFCSMLERLGLMSSIYPQEWLSGPCQDDFIKSLNTDSSLTIATGQDLKAIALEVQRYCSTKPILARSFTVTFEEVPQDKWDGSKVAIMEKLVTTIAIRRLALILIQADS